MTKDNILIPLNRDYSLLKLIDFGLSASLSSLEARVCDAECGTILFMSQERLNQKRYNTKADIYSLGIILLELLTGPCTVGSHIKDKTQARDYFIRYNWSRDTSVNKLSE